MDWNQNFRQIMTEEAAAAGIDYTTQLERAGFGGARMAMVDLRGALTNLWARLRHR